MRWNYGEESFGWGTGSYRRCNDEGSNGVATAIRKSNGEIEVDLKKIKPLTQKNKVFSLPIIRGFITLIDSLIIGIKTLNYSASFIEELDKESSKLDDWIEEKFKGKATDIIMGISFIVSMALSILIFFYNTYICS